MGRGDGQPGYYIVRHVEFDRGKRELRSHNIGPVRDKCVLRVVYVTVNKGNGGKMSSVWGRVDLVMIIDEDIGSSDGCHG